MKRIMALLYAISLAPCVHAQEPGTAAAPPQARPALLAPAEAAKSPAASAQKIVLPSGTRLALRLGNRIITGTA